MQPLARGPAEPPSKDTPGVSWLGWLGRTHLLLEGPLTLSLLEAGQGESNTLLWAGDHMNYSVTVGYFYISVF